VCTRVCVGVHTRMLAYKHMLVSVHVYINPAYHGASALQAQ
jgi:hypothetical protein